MGNHPCEKMYLEKSSQESSTHSRTQRKKGTALGRPPGHGSGGRRQDSREQVAVGALYKGKVTSGGRRGQKVRDLDLVQLVADRHCLVDGARQKGFVVLCLRILKVHVPVFRHHGLVFRFVPAGGPHLKS